MLVHVSNEKIENSVLSDNKKVRLVVYYEIKKMKIKRCPL